MGLLCAPGLFVSICNLSPKHEDTVESLHLYNFTASTIINKEHAASNDKPAISSKSII